MPSFARAVVVALAAVATAASSVAAQSAAQGPTAAEPSSLEFLGFHPGDRLDAIADRSAELDGTLHCDRAHADPRVLECRAKLIDPRDGTPIDLWSSAVDSVAGVVTLSGPVDVAQLEIWRSGLQRRYGSADARAQGPQWMMQWVRRGRMIRLTWRVDRNEKVASVSLVDGRVLDAWGRDRAAR